MPHSTAKVQKKIIGDCLSGEGRPKVDGWLPRYMAFPAEGYAGRFVDSVRPKSEADEAEEEFDSALDDAA